MKKKNLILYVLFSLAISFTGYSQEKSEQILLSEKVLDFFQENETDSIYILLDAQMQSLFSANKLTKIWADLNLQAGQYIQVLDQETAKSADYSAVINKCEFEQAYLDFKLVFNSENKIAGMFFTPSTE